MPRENSRVNRSMFLRLEVLEGSPDASCAWKVSGKGLTPYSGVSTIGAPVDFDMSQVRADKNGVKTVLVEVYGSGTWLARCSVGVDF